MRHLFSALLLASAFTAVPATAYADQIDDFVLTGGGNTIAFSLPATQTFYNHPHIVYLGYTAVPGTVNGVGGYSIAATFFYPAYSFVGIAQFVYTPSNMSPIDNPFFGFSPLGVTDNPPVPPNFNPQYGTLTNTFQLGTFDLITYELMTGIRTPYTLTITPEAATSLTPEPATLALLATGSLGLLTNLRRRLNP